MRFQCPACKGIVAVDNTDLGLLVQCGYCGEAVTVPDSRVAPGAVIADFIIQKELGRGGMGVVYLSHQISLDRSAALKVLSDTHANDSQFVNSFIREARAAAKLNHHYIVQAYAVGEDEGVFYFAMEDIGGKTMKDILAEQKKLPVDQALLIVQQIAEALNYAWMEQKLIHRDIKPDNIMLTASGRAKLADLGLASIGEETYNEDSAEVFGTPQYISPEHLTGAPTDGRSDIYSLGATLYHFVTGNFPYNGKTANEIAAQHLHGTLIPPHEVDPDIPLEVSQMIMRMMERNPQNRYQSAAELIDDIRKIRHASDAVTASIHLPPVSSSGGDAPAPTAKKSSGGKKLQLSKSHAPAGRKAKSGKKASGANSGNAKQWVIVGSIFGVLLVASIIAVAVDIVRKNSEAMTEEVVVEEISAMMNEMQILRGKCETENMTAGTKPQKELMELFHTKFPAIAQAYDPEQATDEEKAIYNDLLAYYMRAHSYFTDINFEAAAEKHTEDVKAFGMQYVAVRIKYEEREAEKQRAIEAEKRKEEERLRKIEEEKREQERKAREREANKTKLEGMKASIQKKLSESYSKEKTPEQLKAIFDEVIKPCLESPFLQSEDMELRTLARSNEEWALELKRNITDGFELVNLRQKAYSEKLLVGLDLRIGGKMYRIAETSKGALVKRGDNNFSFPLKKEELEKLSQADEELLIERLAEKKGLYSKLWAYYLLKGNVEKARELNTDIANILPTK